MKYILITCVLFGLLGCQRGQYDYLKSFDDTRIAYTDAGKGRPVMLLHGFIGTGESWRGAVLYPALLEAGYRVIVPDLRGNGKSDIPTNASAYENKAEVRDLISLANQLNLKDFDVVGYSRGSIVLAEWLTVDDRIKNAVFGGMGIDFTDPEWPRRLLFAGAFSGTDALTEETRGAVEYASSIGANLEALGLQQQFQPAPSREALAKISARTLVLRGRQDQDNGDPAALNAILPDSALEYVAGDHNGAYRQEEFARAVVRFLGS